MINITISLHLRHTVVTGTGDVENALGHRPADFQLPERLATGCAFIHLSLFFFHVFDWKPYCPLCYSWACTMTSCETCFVISPEAGEMGGA